MGHKKTPRVKPSTATSAFNGVQTYNYGGPFGTGTSQKQGNQLNTNFTFGAPYQNELNLANQGISNAQGYINQTPDQMLANLDAGKNAYYNYQHAQNLLAGQKAFGDLQTRMGQNGLDNSTLFGGYAAQNDLNQNLLDLATRNQAIDQSNQMALQNMAANSGLQNQLYGIQSGLEGQANSNLLHGFDANNQMGMFNAGQLQNASAQNANLQMQQNQMNSNLLGNIIGGGAALAMAPFTGGTSLLGAGMNALGGMFNKGQINPSAVSSAFNSASQFAPTTSFVPSFAWDSNVGAGNPLLSAYGGG